MVENFSATASFLWSVADLLRGDFKQSQYGRVILPFTLLRRLECVLAPTKQAVLDKVRDMEDSDLPLRPFLLKAANLPFYNRSAMDLSKLGESHTLDNLDNYLSNFSEEARVIFENFRFSTFLERLDDANLLYKVVDRFAKEDLSPERYDNHTMGLIFEELIRKFAESSNETAGEHFTPRDIVRLTTALLFTEQQEKIGPGKIVTVYDPTAGTGGFLSAGEEYIHSISSNARVTVFGQELNAESYAICMADMLIKGHDVSNIKHGNTLSDDQLADKTFDFMLSNPPFGVDWKKVKKQVVDEHEKEGFAGRFGPGLPRVSDGSLLFLMHLISKMRPKKEGGSRIGIILNGSPLFTGGAGSGESEIRRYILENDLLEAIVALPTDMFYNTGIATYVWILSNHKPVERKGKVQLINAGAMDDKMRKSLGSKRKYLNETTVDDIVRIYGAFEETKTSKIFDTTDFGFRRITVERPLQLAFYPKDEDRLAALQADKGWEKLDDETQNTLLSALAAMAEEKYLKRSAFRKELKTHLGETKLTAALFKLLQKHLGEHDEEAEICKNKGEPEPNSDLRDYENVPLSESVEEYFQREVLPHVPNAWIDEGKTDAQDGEVGIVGYEIHFVRLFTDFSGENAQESRIQLKAVISLAKDGKYFWNPQLPGVEKANKDSGHRFHINEEKLRPDYFNLFLSEGGSEDWLNYATNGKPIWNLSVGQLLQCKIELPAVEVQDRFIRLADEHDALRSRVETIRPSILSNPDWAERELEKYQDVTSRYEDGLTHILPHPLAVLWVQAWASFSEKEFCENICKFYEYLGLFSISAILGQLEQDALHSVLKKVCKSVDRPQLTMGSAYNLLNRVRLRYEEHIDAILRLLISEPWENLLKSATGIRNEVAHQGLTSKSSINSCKKKIDRINETFIGCSRDLFEQISLVKPESSRYVADGSKGNFFNYQAASLDGLALNPAVTRTVDCREPLIDRGLYLVSGRSSEPQTAHRVFPFMTVLDTDAETGIQAFYFYNKWEKDIAKYLFVCPYPCAVHIKQLNDYQGSHA